MVGPKLTSVVTYGVNGTYNHLLKDSDEGNVVSESILTTIGDNNLKDRRVSLRDRISRSASLVSSTLAATERLIPDDELPETPERVKPGGISNTEAALQLTKNIVGTGILFMPKAFQAVGVWQGLAMTCLIAILTIIYFGFVVEASQHFCKVNKVSSYSYGDTVRLSLEKWAALRRFSHLGRHVTSALIIISCYSAAIIYVLMAAKNIRDSLLFAGWNVPLRAAIAVQLPFLIWTNSCKSLKRVTPMTVAGLILLWAGIGLTIYYILTDLKFNGPRPVEKWLSVTQLPAFFSIALFAFNGITALTAIENNMQHPASFVGCPSVVCTVVTLVAIVYSSYGLLGYVAYGANTQGPVSDNFETAAAVAIVLKLCIALGLFFSCPITLFAPLSIVSQCVATWAPPGQVSTYKMLSRWLQVSFIVLVPLIVEDIMALMQLVGVVFTLLQFVLPVVVNTLCFWETWEKPIWRVVFSTRNIIYYMAGITFVFVGFYSGIAQVIKSYS